MTRLIYHDRLECPECGGLGRICVPGGNECHHCDGTGGRHERMTTCDYCGHEMPYDGPADAVDVICCECQDDADRLDVAERRMDERREYARTPLSPTAESARRPPPPEDLVTIGDDKPHDFGGRGRAVKTGRNT